jgi:pimeloyl-ACP methyl ester carboxylesterase
VEQPEDVAFSVIVEQMRRSDEQHRTPSILLVPTGGEDRRQDDPLWRIWTEEQLRWAAGRPEVEVVLVPDSGHHVARERPQTVISAIRRMIQN